VDATEHWFRYPTEKADLVYVELVSQDAEVGTPVRALIVVPR
jgi:hypothetical protein